MNSSSNFPFEISWTAIAVAIGFTCLNYNLGNLYQQGRDGAYLDRLERECIARVVDKAFDWDDYDPVRLHYLQDQALTICRR